MATDSGKPKDKSANPAPESVNGDSDSVEVAIFPLTHVTLFPQTTKPLNIFEPRYIKMVNDCLESGRLIALAFASPVPSKVMELGVKGQLKAVAGVGKVRLLEKRPDNTMLILIEAIGKVRLESVIDDDPYLRARAHLIKENVALADEYLFVLHRLMKDFGRWLDTYIEDPAGRTQFMSNLETNEQKINAICSLMVLDADIQQALLETDSLDERCLQLSMAIESEGRSQ